MAENLQVKWRTISIVLAALLALAIVAAVLAVAIATSYSGQLPKDVADRVSAHLPPMPTATVTVGPTPAPLSDQVAVAFSLATGWPNKENQYDYVQGYESVGDDLIVHTNETAPTDLSELCTQLYQLNDDVLGLDPKIDQILATGTDGQVIWSCAVTSEVQ